MKTQAYARLLGEDLAVGESTNREKCPSCQGGTSRESSFTVTRQLEGLVYNCYRASCGERGFVGTHGSIVKPGIVKQKLREYWHPVRGLTSNDVTYFMHRFQINPTTSTLYIKGSDFDEYIFPIYDIRGLERGYQVRQPAWQGKVRPPRSGRDDAPKARTFPHVREPMQSFYLGGGNTGDLLVVVEDPVSAIKVAQLGVNCVALLGTTVNADKVREWSLLKPKQVLIALDEDATDVAFKIGRKWGLAFEKTRVVCLDFDLKDTDLEDILDILGVEL